MKKKICCFAGHSKLYNSDITEEIYKKAEDLIINHNVTEFWIGDYGDFDHYAIKAINKLKEKYDIKSVCVVAYYYTLEGERGQKINKRFDETIVADIPEKTPIPLRILKTNQYMVDNSDYLICYIKNEWGGAHKTYEYAKRKKHIAIFNLCEQIR